MGRTGGKTDRNAPKRARSSESRYSLMEFDREFPDDATCMDYLVARLYPDGIYCPNCGKVTNHYRVKARTCYECQFCGHQEYPMKGTIFEGSSTSLRLWFYAIYLMASTRCGISAKQLERETGVTYPTAHRMFKQIRSLLYQDAEPLSGTVEADEAYMGGQGKWKHGHDDRRTRPRGGRDRRTVLGMAQRGRDGQKGKVRALVVESAGKHHLLPEMKARILPESVVYTDSWRSYLPLEGMGYHHSRIPHEQKVYVMGDVHTQTIEGFWSLVKRGISGVHHSVSDRYLQNYLDEFVFRYNNRGATGRGMFDAFFSRVRKAPTA